MRVRNSSRRPFARAIHALGERRVTLDNFRGACALGLHRGNRSHWNTGSLEHRLAAHDALHTLDHSFSFSKRLGTCGQLLPCPRDIDDKIVVRPNGIGIRVLVYGIKKTFAALGGQDRSDAIPELQPKQILISKRSTLAADEMSRDDPLVDRIVHRLHSDPADCCGLGGRVGVRCVGHNHSP